MKEGTICLVPRDGLRRDSVSKLIDVEINQSINQ